MKLSREVGQELERKFEEFKKVRFPGMTSSAFTTEEAEEEAAHLHLDLAEYDAFIADPITRLHKGEDVEEQKLYIAGSLKHRLEAFGKRHPESLSFIEGHLRYLGIVSQLVENGKDDADRQ